MNKANLFKRKTHSQNENIPPSKSKIFSQTHQQNHSLRSCNHSSSSCNQNFFLSNSANPNLTKYTSPARRLKTQNFQIEPFSQIDNFMQFANKNYHEDIFIKTKRVKIHSKTPIRQSEERPSSKKNNQFQTNFQILKKQIQELQSLQILRGASGFKQELSQMVSVQPYDKNGDKQWKQDDGFIANNEFGCGKNISLMEKQRQNIKKVMKNKKFRNYISLHKKDNEDPLKKQKNDSSAKEKDFLLNETLSKTFVSLKNPETLFCVSLNNAQTTQYTQMLKSDQLKRKQTPQIVRKYYRPQSCNPKRQVLSYNSRPKKMKVELANFMSFSSFSRSCEKRSTPKVQLSKSLYNQTIQNAKKNKELLVVCL